MTYEPPRKTPSRILKALYRSAVSNIEGRALKIIRNKINGIPCENEAVVLNNHKNVIVIKCGAMTHKVDFGRYWSANTNTEKHYADELQKLNNENIASISDVYQFPDNLVGIITMPLNGFTLRFYVGKLQAEEILIIALGVMNALSSIHNHGEHGLVHLAITPDNIMLHNEFAARIPKVFNFSLVRSKGLNHKFAEGVGPYVHPLLTFDKELPLQDMTQADAWSLGVTLHEVFTGTVPEFSYKESTESIEGKFSTSLNSMPAAPYHDQLSIVIKSCLSGTFDMESSMQNIKQWLSRSEA